MGQRCCRERRSAADITVKKGSDHRCGGKNSPRSVSFDRQMEFLMAPSDKIAAEETLEQIRTLRIGERGRIIPVVFDFKDASRLGTADDPSEAVYGLLRP
jgi:hypothetical protein